MMCAFSAAPVWPLSFIAMYFDASNVELFTVVSDSMRSLSIVCVDALGLALPRKFGVIGHLLV